MFILIRLRIVQDDLRIIHKQKTHTQMAWLSIWGNFDLISVAFHLEIILIIFALVLLKTTKKNLNFKKQTFSFFASFENSLFFLLYKKEIYKNSSRIPNRLY